MMQHTKHISQKITLHIQFYECEGARTCAIELKSFSKNAGFTGVRLGYTVIPKDLKCGDTQLHALWARRHGTKYNGAPYIVQRAGEAVYSEAGKAQLKEQVGYYMNNAKVIFNGLAGCRIHSIWWCQCTIHLVKDTRQHDILGILRSSVRRCQRRWNTRIRIRTKRRRILPPDSIWNIRKHSSSNQENQRNVKL